MSRLALGSIALLLLTGCEKHAAVALADPCQTPPLSPPAHAAGTTDGEDERVTLCMKTAVRELDRAGGAVEVVAKVAVARCAAEERAEYAAMARHERVYQWEKDEMHDMLQHSALLNARQTRSRGCGRTGGAAEEP
ncbi:MAG: hypothetical protein JO111_16585 [Caulobacteraceae bacterium]|nr:hypothetical protein [Caulobacteraceae bacterium]